MEKGIHRAWTPGREIEFEERLKHCRTFAERHMTLLLRDVLKYDGRSKESKRAMAQARLRLAVFSDEDLKELAELQASMEEEKPEEIPGLHRASLVAENLGILKDAQTKIREGLKGVT